MDASAIATLPRGLVALYRAIFQRRFDTKQAEWDRLRAILELVVVTRAPFPIALAAQMLGDSAVCDPRFDRKHFRSAKYPRRHDAAISSELDRISLPAWNTVFRECRARRNAPSRLDH
jgi:dihydrodipicolinate synthase/N-acetylneuraminate lyase